MTIRAVFFDIGETLVDETSQWGGWADWLGIPRLTFFAVLGGVIQRGEHHRRVFELLRPGIDVAREQAARVAAGHAEHFDRSDFYPDAIPCLEALRRQGYRIGLAGNQPEGVEELLRAMALPVDLIASSAGWGVEKPSPEFFARVAALAGVPPSSIAYVGDRVDNDVAPAADTGMVAVFLRRGPWGFLQADHPAAARARIRLDSLDALPDALRRLDDGAV
jgi:HAD superfamily hydrolase (TIGR01549 family)